MTQDEKRAVPIYDCDLSVRIQNALASNNINTLGELIDTPSREIRKIKLLGNTSLRDIHTFLKNHGFNWSTESKKSKVLLADGTVNDAKGGGE